MEKHTELVTYLLPWRARNSAQGIRCSIPDITSGAARIVVADSAIISDFIKIVARFFEGPRLAEVCWRKPTG